MIDGQNTLYLQMNGIGKGDQKTTMIRPSNMNILKEGIPMLGV